MFGDTMCLHDPDDEFTNPALYAASVPIPADLAKAIKVELKTSYVVLEDHETGAYGTRKRPVADMGDLSTQMEVRYALNHFALPILTTRLYAHPECAKFKTPHLLRWRLMQYWKLRNKF